MARPTFSARRRDANALVFRALERLSSKATVQNGVAGFSVSTSSALLFAAAVQNKMITLLAFGGARGLIELRNSDMPLYRVHILDSSGKVIGAGQFDCVNSEIARERVKQLAGDLDTELWQLVSSFQSSTMPYSDATHTTTRARKRLDS